MRPRRVMDTGKRHSGRTGGAVLFLSLGFHPDRVGGAYRYVAEMAEGLAARGHWTGVIYPNVSPPLPEVEERRGVRLFRTPNPSGFFAANWLEENRRASEWARRVLREEAPGALVVLCHAYFWRAARGIRDRTVFLFTGPWAEEHLFSARAEPGGFARRVFRRGVACAMRAQERRALKRCRAILTISEYYRDRLPGWHGSKLAPLEVISGGVNLQRFRPLSHRGEARARWGLGAGDFLFLALRRLDPRMGLRTLIDAFAEASQACPRARLWIVGEGAESELLKRRVAALRCESVVRFLGRVGDEDVPTLLGAADCTVMPSLDLEGFGLATVESLACGTPVIGSRAGANPELIGPLSPDLLFEAGDASELCRKLRAVVENRVALPERDECRRYAEREFSWCKPISRLERRIQ